MRLPRGLDEEEEEGKETWQQYLASVLGNAST